MVERPATQMTARYALATSLPSTRSGQDWDHLIRDEDDFNRHMDYIHWNPVKHGFATKVNDWPYSSFHRLVRIGWYPENWGENITFDGVNEFGE
jgi:putative transposase